MNNHRTDEGKPIVLITKPSLANPEDVNIPRCVKTADEAIALIREYHTRWVREAKA